MKTLIKIALIIFIGIGLIIYFNLYYITPGFLVKSELESFISNKLGQKIKIIKIKNQYSPDLFHQVTGYKIEIEDNTGFKYDKIYVQQNQVTKEWNTYMTLDIKKEYLETKARMNRE